MTGSVPRAITELEQLREDGPSPELRELIEILVRLLTAARDQAIERMNVMANEQTELQRILDDINRTIEPSAMSKKEAVEFLEQLISECESQCEALQEELDGEDEDDEDEGEDEKAG
jgi:translation initiation factor 2B subunit (eIF-2B alpha/beta/delta family)